MIKCVKLFYLLNAVSVITGYIPIAYKLRSETYVMSFSVFFNTLALVWLLGAMGASSWNCTEAEIDRCYDVFTPYETDIMETVILRNMDDTVLDRLCSEYEAAARCIKRIEEQCHIMDRLVFWGRNAAYEWLCETGKQEYREIRSCFSEKALHNEGLFCNSSLVEALDRINHNVSQQHSASKICLAANNYLDCVENAVRHECGSNRAAAWQRQFDYLSLNPLLSGVGCRLDDDGRLYYLNQSSHKSGGWTSTTSVIVACIVVMSLLMVATLVFILFHMRRRSKQRAARRESSAARMQYVADALGRDATVNTIYPGGAIAGPLPDKGPLSPPVYDNHPPPDYSSEVGQATGAAGGAAGVGEKTRDASSTQLPAQPATNTHHQAGSAYDYAGAEEVRRVPGQDPRQSGYVQSGAAYDYADAASVRSGATASSRHYQNRQALSGQKYLDSDARSTKSHHRLASKK